MLKIDTATLLQKEMDRKDFLKHIGIGIIALSGLSAVLRTLVQQPTASKSVQQVGYGGSAYGGTKTDR